MPRGTTAADFPDIFPPAWVADDQASMNAVNKWYAAHPQAKPPTSNNAFTAAPKTAAEQRRDAIAQAIIRSNDASPFAAAGGIGTPGGIAVGTQGGSTATGRGGSTGAPAATGKGGSTATGKGGFTSHGQPQSQADKDNEAAAKATPIGPPTPAQPTAWDDPYGPDVGPQGSPPAGKGKASPQAEPPAFDDPNAPDVGPQQGMTTSPHGSQTAVENALGLTTPADPSDPTNPNNVNSIDLGINDPTINAQQDQDMAAAKADIAAAVLGFSPAQKGEINDIGDITGVPGITSTPSTNVSPAPTSMSPEGLNAAFSGFTSPAPGVTASASMTGSPHGSQTAVENALGLTTTAPLGKQSAIEGLIAPVMAQTEDPDAPEQGPTVANTAHGFMQSMDKAELAQSLADTLSTLAAVQDSMQGLVADAQQTAVAPASQTSAPTSPDDTAAAAVAAPAAISAPDQATTDANVAAALGYGAPDSGFSVSGPATGDLGGLGQATGDTANLGAPDQGAPDQGTVSQADADAAVAAALGDTGTVSEAGTVGPGIGDDGGNDGGVGVA